MASEYQSNNIFLQMCTSKMKTLFMLGNFKRGWSQEIWEGPCQCKCLPEQRGTRHRVNDQAESSVECLRFMDKIFEAIL